MSLINVIIYSKENCPQCVVAKHQLNRFSSLDGLHIENIMCDVTNDEVLSNLKQQFPEAKTFPIIEFFEESSSTKKVYTITNLHELCDELNSRM